jgi:hypothetical protein
VRVETLIAWCGFLGAWLLFAGPIFQAALELQEESREADRIEAEKDELAGGGSGRPWSRRSAPTRSRGC